MESFSSSFWNENQTDFTGFEVLCRKLKAGKRMWNEYIEFLRLRAHAQENYGKTLVKISKLCCGKEEIGALKQAWSELSARTELVGLDNMTLAGDLIKEANSLHEKLEIDRHKRKHAEAEVIKLQNCRKSAIKKVSEMKRNYFHKSKQSEQIGQALLAEMGKSNIHPKEIDKLKMKHSKSLDCVNEADVVYKESLNSLEEVRIQWEKQTSLTCQLFEDLEKNRVKCLRDSFWDVSNLFSAYATKEDDNQEEIRKILEKLDLEGDIQLFIKDNQTGKNRPKPVAYEPYRGDNLSCGHPSPQLEKKEPIYAIVNKNGKNNLETPDDAFRESKQDCIKTTPERQTNSKPELTTPTLPAPSTLIDNEIYDSMDNFEEFAWRVLESYKAQSNFEISLAKDEYVQVINQTNREWWHVKNQAGQTGYFPSNKLEYGAHTDVV